MTSETPLTSPGNPGNSPEVKTNRRLFFFVFGAVLAALIAYDLIQGFIVGVIQRIRGVP